MKANVFALPYPSSLSLLPDNGLSGSKLGKKPEFAKLTPRLVFVRLLQKRVSRVRDIETLFPYPAGGAIHQTDRKLCDIARNERLTGKDRVMRRHFRLRNLYPALEPAR